MPAFMRPLLWANRTRAAKHSGPLPSPKQLAKYNELLPGTADIIIGDYQANCSHVRNMERLAL
jgi:uncharacterized membrane protein